MTKTADILRRLHHIHRQLADLNERLDRGPKQIKAREANVASLEADLKAAREKTVTARMAADDKQVQLKGGESKIVELRTKLNTAASNREYQALLEQIAAAEMTNSVLEDEILEALEKIEQMQIANGESEQRLDAGKKELESARKTVSAKAQEIEADVVRIKTELQVIEGDLPADFRSEYDRFVRAKGEDALAAVEEDCCSGCNKQVSANMISKLMMDQVVCCTSCGRILYFPEDRSIGGG